MYKRMRKLRIGLTLVMVLALSLIWIGGTSTALNDQKPWEMIKWNEPKPWPERLTSDHYILPEGWKEATKGVKEITYYNSGALQSDIATVMNIKTFEKLTGIKVNAIPVAPSLVYPKSLSTLVSKDKSIHAVDLNDPTNDLAPLSNWLQPVDILWPPEVQELYNPHLENYLKWGDHWYAMPVAAVGHLMFYRTSWLANAGVDVPKTMQEFYDTTLTLSKWAKEALGKDRYGMTFPAGTRGLFIRYRELMYSQGKKLYENGKFQFTSEEGKKAFEFLVNLMKEGAVPKDALSFTWIDSANFFGVGKAAFAMSTPSMFYGFFQSQYPEGAGKDLNVFVPPKWDKESPDEYAGRAVIGANSMGLPKYIDDKHKAAVMLWYDYLRSLQAQRNEAIVEGNASFLLNLWENLDEQFAKVDWELADEVADELEIGHPEHITSPNPMILGNKIQSKKAVFEVYPPSFPQISDKFVEEYSNAALGKITVDKALKRIQELADKLT